MPLIEDAEEEWLRNALTRHLPRLLPPFVIVFYAASVGFLLAIAWAAGLVSDFGHHVHPAFYTSIAGVLPFLLVALVTAEGFHHLMVAGADEARYESIAGLITVVALFLVGEGCALYAVATQVSTTFLVVMPCIAGIVSVLGITEGVLARAGLRTPRTAESIVKAELESALARRQRELADRTDELSRRLISSHPPRTTRPPSTTIVRRRGTIPRSIAVAAAAAAIARWRRAAVRGAPRSPQ